MINKKLLIVKSKTEFKIGFDLGYRLDCRLRKSPPKIRILQKLAR